jgi:endonuclease/exonuclease/phosphatase family metal-dependent hydrolase
MTPLLLILGFACEPIVTVFEDVEEAEYYHAAEPTTPPAVMDSLLVMTWNIKYGGGDIDFWWACHGDRVLMTEDEVVDNLDSLVSHINQVDPDILLLQEVDVGSKRAAYVDQMQYILDHTALNHGVYGSMWRVQFAPSDGLGRADLGPAILSRWRLRDAERIGLALRTDQDALTNYFYIRRCMIKAELEIPGWDDFHAVTVHTAAWSQDDTKLKHINRFKEELDDIVSEGGWFVAGGDLNTIPPGSDQLQGFQDAVCGGDFEGGDFSDEQDYLTDLYASTDYATAIPLDEYQQADDQSPYFTYGDKPDSFGFTRKLDYLFTNMNWISGSAHTHLETASPGQTLSDHAPVSAKLYQTGH